MSSKATSAQTPSFDIFLSHAGEDKETIARPLCKRLREHGISVFFDVESFLLGDDCPKVMDQAMQTAPVGVFIMSPEFVAKEWPIRELITFVKRLDHAEASKQTPPLLIPVFYRLETRDCRNPAIFDTYSSLFLQHGLFKRAMDGTVLFQDVSHALHTAATVWSIENDLGASNLDRPHMACTRKSFIHLIQNRILERLRKERPKLAYKCRPLEDAQPPHQDEYMRCNMVPSNPPRLTLDYDSNTTCEGRLKAAVLGDSTSQIVAVIASGKGGVGKTCALRELAKDVQIKEAFPGGILYIQLGNDARTSDLVKGIAKMVDRTGGLNAKTEIQAAETVQEASEKASKWFDSRVCLFLIDDIWKLHGIDSNVFPALGLMMNERSRMVYTTRDQHFLRRADEVIEFKEREALGDLSRQMLRTHAGIEEDTVLSPKNEKCLKYFLTLCQGLPLGFGIVGGTVWDYSRQCPNEQDALSEFYSEVSSNEKKNWMDAKADDYGRLSNIVDLSLQVLEKRNVDVNYERRFRALCVLQKQQSVPAQMLQKLWDLDTLRSTINVVESFANVSVVQMTRKDGFVFVQLHDLVLEIAVRKASGETRGFFQQLVRNYISSNPKTKGDGGLTSVRINADKNGQLENAGNHISARKRSQGEALCGNQTDKRFRYGESTTAKTGMLIEQPQGCFQRDTTEEQLAQTLESQLKTQRGVEEGVVVGATEKATSLAFCHAWWDTEDDGYIYKNVCRLLRRAGFVEELLWLLSQPQWVVKRLVEGGIFDVEQDLKHGEAKGDNASSQHADRNQHLKMICVAAGMSASFVTQNPREVWFQLHGRLLWHATRSERTRDFVERMEMCAPKPWLKASMGFLLQAGCGAKEVVSGPGRVLCSRVEGDKIWILWNGVDGLHVGRYDQTNNRHEYVVLAREEGMGDVQHASFLPDQRSIVTNHEDGSIRVWNRRTGYGSQVISHECKNHKYYIRFHAEGARVACTGSDHSIQLWDSLSGKPVGRPLRGHTDAVFCAAESPDGTRIVSGSYDNTIRVWDAESGNAIGEPLRGHADAVVCVEVSADGTRIVSGSRDHTVRVWDAQRGTAVGEPFQGHTDAVWRVAVSKDGARIVSGSVDMTVRVWDAQSGNAIGQPLRGHTREVLCLKVSEDGTRIVSGSADRTLIVWDVQSGNAVGQPLQGHTDEVWCAAASPDGTRIVSGSGDNTVRVWDAESGNAVGQPLRGHTEPVWCVAMSTDRTRIVSGSCDGTVRVWDAQSCNAVGQPLRGHEDTVTCVALSEDGTRIVSGSEDRTVRVWDAQGGNAVGQPLRGHKDRLEFVEVSADGTRVVSEDDYDIRYWIWDAGGGAWSDPGGQVIPEGLTRSSGNYWHQLIRTIRIVIDDASQVVLGTCERPVHNFDGGDVYFDHMFASCRIVR